MSKKETELKKDFEMVLFKLQNIVTFYKLNASRVPKGLQEDIKSLESNILENLHQEVDQVYKRVKISQSWENAV